MHDHSRKFSHEQQDGSILNARGVGRTPRMSGGRLSRSRIRPERREASAEPCTSPPKADYALRAVAEIAAASPGGLQAPELAARQSLPRKYLEAALRDLRRAGIVNSKLGVGGGFTLQRPANKITVAEVIRATDGPLVTIRGRAPDDTTYSGVSEPLRRVWIAARRSLRDVLEAVTVADLMEGQLPPAVARLADDDESWVRH